ncbi:MAG: DNA repair photolyase [Candidatus Improbicoccus devescovinae]|nr:MAG: DNA repair photolyase [Candidatus Improbicoccus devescovinae]
MPSCGTQCILCDLPIRFDTYRGCSHGCKYCFTQRNFDIKKIKKHESLKSLKKFINFERNGDINWCDWKIPLHWGGLSDPFQPIEKKIRNSFNCLNFLVGTQYPFVVSTKGAHLGDDQYLELLSKCNCVVQVSLVCDKYDKIEPEAPSFEQRLEIIQKVSRKVNRVIVRIQPYMCEVFEDVFKNLKKFKESGAYGVILEGMKFIKKKSGLVKVAGDFCYPKEKLEEDFLKLRDESHRLGLKFYAGENRLRKMGDSLTCCGIENLPGFIPNKYNLNHIIHDETKPQPSELQQKIGTAYCFKSFYQNSLYNDFFKDKSFQNAMEFYAKNKSSLIKEIFGL